jgi:DNA-binding winged helix-turn-helix (wHTH) protein/tetratricopeptide (TPR) repeat protein
MRAQTRRRARRFLGPVPPRARRGLRADAVQDAVRSIESAVTWARPPPAGQGGSGEGPGTDRVDLAKSAAFRIGRLGIHPPTREIVGDDGRREVVEPRVMQVLIALARAAGAIVTRDELTERCWEGRIVGEDAINRVISRLRKVADGIGAGSFRIETVTKVGYRLVRPGDPPVAETVPAAAAPWTGGRIGRRAALAAGAAAAAAAAGAWALWGSGGDEGDDDPLMAQAMVALRQETVEGNSQALGLLRQVVARRPDNADAWGALALAYAFAFAGRGSPGDAAMRARALSAAARAREQDPRNPFATLALAYLKPQLGTWLEREHMLRDALEAHPDHDFLLRQLGWLMGNVGRWREGARLLDRAARLAPSSPGLLYAHVWTLWGAGRLVEADQALDRALELFPTYYSLWFARYYIYLYSGRAREALALVEDRAGRPTGIPESEFDLIALIARATVSHSRAEVDRAVSATFEAAHRGSGHAENAIQHVCGFGRLDTAFAIADALYFARGFDPGEVRFSAEQRTYTRRPDRRTYVLFLPSTEPMRTDPRFAPLVAALGLARYWAASGSLPDYRR